MHRYVHGSRDSTDLDVMYVTDVLPSMPQAQQFYREHPGENINFILIRDGCVAECLKGHPDEVNNALLHTYPLHLQADPLLITHPVPRDVFLKDITLTRKFLSPLTRTPRRPVVKAALRGDWQTRLQVLRETDFSREDLGDVRGRELQDVIKSMAFSLGQAVGLHRGVELYTKAEIADAIPELAPYLYRQSLDLQQLQQVLSAHLEQLAQISVLQNPDGTVTLAETGGVYNIHKELRLR